MADEIKSDVQEMNKSFGYDEKEPEQVEEVEEQETEDSADVVEDVETVPDQEEQETETETVDEEQDTEPESEPEQEEDEKDKIIAELRRKLDEKESKEEPEQETETEPQEPTFDVQNFIDEDEDIEDLVREPARFNEMLNKVYQKAVLDTQKSLGEGVLRSIPDIVRNSVTMLERLKDMNKKFYSENEDLSPFKRVVAAVFEEVASDNPDKQMEDLLPMVADESRKRLQLHKKASEKVRRPPRLPARKGRMTIAEDKPNTDPLLNELQEMNKTLGGM